MAQKEIERGHLGQLTGDVSWLSVVPYLAYMEVARRYAGSVFGVAWAIAYPALQIFVYWALFALGLQIRIIDGVPFEVMLLAGIIPWFMFADGLSALTSTITGNSALVKRILFPLEILPISSLLASFYLHCILMVLTIFILWIVGFPPTASLAFLPYYAVCLAVLIFGVGTILAIANAAFRDVSQMLASALWIWFWVTPIVWPVQILHPKWRWIAEFNPVHYVIQGYRHALLGDVVAQPGMLAGVFFWTVSICLLLIAVFAIKRFKRELADLL